MEYSPMMVIVLWALTPSDCVPIDLKNSTEEAATVKEMPRPAMTIQNPSQFTVPGYFTFNDGQPFLVDKDPLTGNLNFNIKTTPVRATQQMFQNSDDYFYEDSDYSKDQIDRKDGDIYGSKPIRENDIKGTTKNQADLHQFLNLPVHYSSYGKFPLISSSYANTKIQGHGSSSYSNHKPYSSTTPSNTVSPTYYTHKSTSQHTEAPTKATTTTTTKATTTTTQTPMTTLRSSTSTSAYEYEYVDYDYDRYEPEHDHGMKLSTTPPSTIGSTTTTSSTTTTTTAAPTTTSVPNTKTTDTTTSTSTKRVTIVTSLPIDHHEDENVDNTPLSIKLSTTTNRIEPVTTNNQILIKDEDIIPSNYPSGFVNNRFNQTINGQTPVRPQQFGNIPNAFDGQLIDNVQGKPVNYGHGSASPPLRPPWGYAVPPFQPLGGSNIYKPPKYPYLPEQNPNFNQKPGPGGFPGQQHTFLTVDTNLAGLSPPPPQKQPPPFFPRDPISGPVERPQYVENHQDGDNISIMVHSNMPKIVDTKLNNSGPQDSISSHTIKQDFTVSSQKPYINSQFENPVSYLGVEHLGGVPNAPNINKRPPVHYVDNPQRPVGSFSLVPKPDNQMVQVSKDQVNPSYSLQTSFSIGSPPQYDEEEKVTQRPGQGIGQVLFPDDEKLKQNANEGRPDLNQRPPRPGGPYKQHPGGMRPPQNGPPQRNPPELLPPAPPGESYPRPPWQTHLKPPYYFGPGNSLQKKDSPPPPPPYYPPKRGKPSAPLHRHDLPNILPQFRPNAKVGQVDHHTMYVSSSKYREPFDTLQPPPLPRPQYLRVQNNDENVLDQKVNSVKEQGPVQLPLVHRRTGQQASSRVPSLPPQPNPVRKAIVRTEYKDYEKKNKDEPVFVVYPSNGHKINPKDNIPAASEGVVVVGTRGSQRPLPPDNLDIEDDLDAFPLDDNNNFPIHARDRVDTPILKSKSTPKPIVKPEFPYEIVKPENIKPEERIVTGVEVKKEYTAYSPTISSSTEEILKDHDSEINLIPYLQDYSPYATKKPLPPKPIEPLWNVEDKSTLKPISVTLNTLLGQTTINPIKNHLMSNTERTGVKGNVEAIYAEKIEPNSSPEPQEFQAPFHASLSEPSQGWSVVTAKNNIDTTIPQQTTQSTTTSPKFDIDSFKPELLSGFKPILPPNFDDDRPEKQS